MYRIHGYDTVAAQCWKINNNVHPTMELANKAAQEVYEKVGEGQQIFVNTPGGELKLIKRASDFKAVPKTSLSVSTMYSEPDPTNFYRVPQNLELETSFMEARESAVTDYVTKNSEELVASRCQMATNLERQCISILSQMSGMMKGSLEIFNEDTDRLIKLIHDTPTEQLDAATNRIRELVTTLVTVQQELESHQKRTCR